MGPALCQATDIRVNKLLFPYLEGHSGWDANTK